MKRKIVVEIETSEDGAHCLPTCPHFAGGCDAFGGELLKRVPSVTARWYRTEKCKEAEERPAI